MTKPGEVPIVESTLVERNCANCKHLEATSWEGGPLMLLHCGLTNGPTYWNKIAACKCVCQLFEERAVELNKLTLW